MASQSSVSITHWVICALILFVLGLWLYQLFGPNPKLVVSRQTTYLITPLKPDGYPDYAAALLARQKAGATPETNGALPFWRAMWSDDPDDRFTAEEARLICNEIGLFPIPDGSESLTPYYGAAMEEKVSAWLAEKVKSETADATALRDATRQLKQDIEAMAADDNAVMSATTEQLDMGELVWEWIDIGMSRPWVADDLPFSAQWLKQNNERIDLLVQAAEAPHWYCPSPSMLKPTSATLVDLSISYIQQARNASRYLSLRAMNRIGKKQYREAWRDIHAIWQLAKKVGHDNGFLVDQLVAVAIGGVAYERTLTLLNSDGLSAELASEISVELAKLGDVVDMAATYDFGERLFTTELVTTSALGGELLDDYFTELETIRHTSVNWNYVLSRLQDHYDELAVAHGKPNYKDAFAILDQIDTDRQAAVMDATTGDMVLMAASRAKRSNYVASAVTAMNYFQLVHFLDSERQSKAKRQMAALAALLVAHHASEGSYPESLANLSHPLPQTLTVDPYQQMPYMYKRTEEGFLLYSCGPNGTDDGGSRLDSSGWHANEYYQGRELPDPEIFPEKRGRVSAAPKAHPR